MFTADPFTTLIFFLWSLGMIFYRFWLGEATKDYQACDTWLITACLLGFVASLIIGAEQYIQIQAMFFAGLLATFALVELPRCHPWYKTKVLLGSSGPVVLFTILIII